jgi:hypothetical protein
MKPSFYKTQMIDVPPLRQSFGGLPIDPSSSTDFDNLFKWSSSLQQEIVFDFSWTVSGLRFREMELDRRNHWKVKLPHRHSIDTPLALVRHALSVEGRPPTLQHKIQGKPSHRFDRWAGVVGIRFGFKI